MTALGKSPNPHTRLPPYPLHERFALIRKWSGMTQIEMATVLGVTQSWLSKLEAGEGEITVAQLIALKNRIGVSGDSVMEGTIPYLDIAEKKGVVLDIPAKYLSNGRVRLRSLYGIFQLAFDRPDGEAGQRLLRKLHLKPYMLAEPRLRVNYDFVSDTLQTAMDLGVISSSEAWAPKAARVALSPVTAFASPDRPAESLLGLIRQFDEELLFDIQPVTDREVSVKIAGLRVAFRRAQELLPIWAGYQAHWLQRAASAVTPGQVTVADPDLREMGEDPKGALTYKVCWS